MSVISNIYGVGVYLRENILNAAADYKSTVLFPYKTVSAIGMDRETFYVVYGHWKEDTLKRDAYRKAFDEFDPNKVFLYGEVKIGAYGKRGPHQKRPPN